MLSQIRKLVFLKCALRWGVAVLAFGVVSGMLRIGTVPDIGKNFVADMVVNPFALAKLRPHAWMD